MHKEEYVAYLSLGSNLGDRIATIESAIKSIGELEEVELTAVSSFYETVPVGFVQQPKFINCAASVLTTLDPLDLLDNLQKIEILFGRQRHQHWGARTLDIDILMCGDKIVREPRLKVPHPLMFERGFVLVPLLEIMPKEEAVRLGIEREAAKFKDIKDIKKI